MKKVVIFILCLILVGCTPSKQEDSPENLLSKQYQEYKNKLIKQTEFIENTPEFSMQLILNVVEKNSYRYDIIIDNPTINLYHIQAIAAVEGDNDKNLPTLGVLEADTFSLIPGRVDKASGVYKGVNLSGITVKKDINVIVYITFYLDKENTKKEERFIRLYGNASR